MQTNEDVKQLRESRQAMGAHSSGGIQLACKMMEIYSASLLFKDISKIKSFYFIMPEKNKLESFIIPNAYKSMGKYIF